MDKHCRICHNTSCSNHGKNISFLGEGWKCNYIPVHTNADRIRAMSDEELAAWMSECNAYREYATASQWLPWLQQPAEEGER